MRLKYFATFAMNFSAIYIMMTFLFIFSGGHDHFIVPPTIHFVLAQVFLVSLYLVTAKIPKNESGRWTEEGFKGVRRSMEIIGLVIGVQMVLLAIVYSMGRIEVEASYKASYIAHAAVSLFLGLTHFLAARMTNYPEVLLFKNLFSKICQR